MTESIDLKKEQWIQQYLMHKAARKLPSFAGEIPSNQIDSSRPYIDLDVQSVIEALIASNQKSYLLKTCRFFVQKGICFNPSLYPDILLFMTKNDFYPTLFIEAMPDLKALQHTREWWNLLSKTNGDKLLRFFQNIWLDRIDNSDFTLGQMKCILNHTLKSDPTMAKSLAEDLVGHADKELSKCGIQFLIYGSQRYQDEYNTWCKDFFKTWDKHPPNWIKASTYWQRSNPWIALTELLPQAPIELWPANIENNFGDYLPLSDQKKRDIAYAYSQSLVSNKSNSKANRLLNMHGLSIPDYMLSNVLKSLDSESYNYFLLQQLQRIQRIEEILLWIDKSHQSIDSANSDVLVALAINELMDYQNCFVKSDFRKSFLHVAWRLHIKPFQYLREVPSEEFRYEKNLFSFLQELYQILEQRTIVHNSLHSYA